MPVDKEAYESIKKELDGRSITLVAVSKTKPAADILSLYELGHRDFGENYVQELVEKAAMLPRDIRWHFIGHLQTNKVKLIAPFVQLIHGVDSLKLLSEINKQAAKAGRVVDCLLQVHIAEEETKFGLSDTELDQIIEVLDKQPLTNTRVTGLMGMASFTDDKEQIRKEFRHIAGLFLRLKTRNSFFRALSIGMSADYQIAVEEGSTMVRVGSLLFGAREKS